MGRSERAFTLLEVLAAVAVLGILYTVLAGVAARGLRGEGESRRRLEASLLADQQLAEVETGANAGLPLGVGRSESEQDPFSIATEVSVFELPPLPAAPGARAEGEGAERDPAAASLFPDPRTGQPSPVRRIDITVSWLEGFEEHSVRRTSFAIDAAEAAGALAVLDAQAAAP